MIICIDMGHTLSGADYGATGHLIESNETRNVGVLVIKYLRELGNTVIDCTVDSAISVDESLQRRVNIANKYDVDIFLSIHFNAGGGIGTEIYVYEGSSSFIKSKAKAVLTSITESCNFKSRGVKTANFFVLRKTKAPAMLIECCFVDTDDYLKYNADKVSKAIVNGLTGTTISNSNKYPKAKVLASVLNVRNGASINSKKIGEVYKNEIVEIKWTEIGWYYIIYDTPNGKKEGYVSADYIEKL